ncbi:hypothetical protein ABBQ38_002717 [Trebouxia sp. C0009 RCD-2024]
MAMEVGGEDMQRLMFFESARAQAQTEYEEDGTNAAALTRWGGALLELAHFRQGDEAREMIKEAVRKLETALQLDDSKPETLWCLGNAYTSEGFLVGSPQTAKDFFRRASGCFEKASELDPSNDVYQKAVEMTKKAPELHAQLHAQMRAQQEEAESGGGGTFRIGANGGSDGRRGATKESSDFWWDVAGWVTLVGLGFGVVTLSRNSATAGVPPPPMPMK